MDEWIKDNRPILDAAGWIAFAMKIASKDLTNLSGIFDLGRSLESEIARQEMLEAETLALRDRASSSTALAQEFGGITFHEQPDRCMM